MEPNQQLLLRRFSADPHTKDAVKAFMEAFIDDYALDIIYKKGDITGVADARDIIRKAFDQIIFDYGKKEEQKESPNQSE